MTIIEYFHERFLFLLWVASALFFALVVYRLDVNLTLSHSNAMYIGSYWLLSLVVFLGVDYLTLRKRVLDLREYAALHAPTEASEFSYPSDRAYAKAVQDLCQSFEEYRVEVNNTSAERMDFITKWLHDVKTPIAGLRLLLETNESVIRPDLYQTIDREVFNVEQAVQKVFYEIKSDKLQEDYKIVRINTRELIVSALKGFASFVSHKKLKVSLDDESYQVATDEKWTGYILSQIIANAVKYTPPGGKIHISTRQDGCKVKISIRNSGSGILPQDIGQVFQRGYTSSKNRGGSTSTGYGLYLANKLAELLGHRLSVASQHGEYACFTLEFVEEPNLHSVTKM